MIWLYRFILRYFEQPRNRVVCLLGAIIVFPTLLYARWRVGRLEEKIIRENGYLLRLELSGALIRTNWFWGDNK